MPPQRSTRDVTLEELFAERICMLRLIDIEASGVAFKMALEFLMINGYIRFRRYTNIYRYPRLFAFIFATAAAKKSIHDTLISDCVRFLDEKDYEKDLKNIFKFIYKEVQKHYSFMRISAFAMNICLHIKRTRLEMWFMRETVLLLSRMFAGNRFQMESSFNELEELASLHHGISYRAILTIAAQSEIPQTAYEDTYVFSRLVTDATRNIGPTRRYWHDS